MVFCVFAFRNGWHRIDKFFIYDRNLYIIAWIFIRRQSICMCRVVDRISRVKNHYKFQFKWFIKIANDLRSHSWIEKICLSKQMMLLFFFQNDYSAAWNYVKNVLCHHLSAMSSVVCARALFYSFFVFFF